MCNLASILGLFLCVALSLDGEQSPQLGKALTPDEVRKIDITVQPDGTGLPEGNGSVSMGETIYVQKCQACHGSQGGGKPMERLTGGVGSIASDKPTKTVVSYWPRATTLFDYVRRAMPLTAPQSLTDNEVYALTAYILSIDGIVAKDAVLDAKSLPQVKMPNANGFVSWWPVPKSQAPKK